MIRPLMLALAGLLVAAAPPSPAQRFGALFRDVQMRQIFPDSKTFADAEPRRDDAAILAASSGLISLALALLSRVRRR